MKIAYIFLFISLSSFGASLDNYTNTILKMCPDIPSLLIKKTALEFSNNLNCDHKFSKQLLSKCQVINCNLLITAFKKNIQSNAGTIVGD